MAARLTCRRSAQNNKHESVSPHGVSPFHRQGANAPYAGRSPHLCQPLRVRAVNSHKHGLRATLKRLEATGRAYVAHFWRKGGNDNFVCSHGSVTRPSARDVPRCGCDYNVATTFAVRNTTNEARSGEREQSAQIRFILGHTICNTSFEAVTIPTARGGELSNRTVQGCLLLKRAVGPARCAPGVTRC